MTCSREEFNFGLSEKIELISNVLPSNVVKADGKVTGVVLEPRDWNQTHPLFVNGSHLCTRCNLQYQGNL